MQTFELVVKFTTNFLGGGNRVHGVRKLFRSDKGSITIPNKELQKEIETTDSLQPWQVADLEATRVNILRRVYNRVRVDRFEGIEKGTGATLILSVGDDAQRADVERLARKLGKSGISQWGRKFNCGKFKLINITKIDL